MNITHLKVFVDLSKTLSYTQTAKNTYMSQPAVTQAIKSLESEIGVKLLERGRTGVHITQSGKAFLSDIELALHAIDDAVNHARATAERLDASVSVGYSGTMLETRKVSVLRQFMMDHPEITIHMENLSMSKLDKRLEDGQCDMVFHIRNPRSNETGQAFYELERGVFVVVVPADHPLGSKKTVSLYDLADEKIILLNSDQCSEQQTHIQEMIKGISKEKKFYYTDSYALMHELIRNKLGITILPDFLEDRSDPNIKLIPIDYDETVEYGITVLKDNDKSVIKKIVEEVIEKENQLKRSIT